MVVVMLPIGVKELTAIMAQNASIFNDCLNVTYSELDIFHFIDDIIHA